MSEYYREITCSLYVGKLLPDNPIAKLDEQMKYLPLRREAVFTTIKSV